MIHPEFGPGRLDATWLDHTDTDADPWLLSTDHPFDEGHRDAFLGNGFLGQRIAIEGESVSSASTDEEVLGGCLMHGLWNRAGLMPVPKWAVLHYSDGIETFSRRTGDWQDYRQTLNMKTGILETNVTWSSGAQSTRIESETFLSRSRPCVSVLRRTIVPDFDGIVCLTDELDGSFIDDARDWRIVAETKDAGVISLETRMGPRERRLTVMSRLVLDGVEEPDISVQQDVQSVTRELRFAVTTGQSYTVTKLVALVSDGQAPEPWLHAFTLVEGAALDLEKLRREHIAAWEELWQHRIEVSHPRLQALITSAEYQLYSCLREGGEWSLGPTGLSGNAWVGRAFWDSDLWMFPGLCLLNPALAKGFVTYRHNTLAGAKRNAQAEGYDGAMIAWESGEFGDETIPERIFHHQHHVNSDVALAQWWYAKVSGDEEYMRTAGAEIIIESAKFWASYATYNVEQDRYEIRRVCCADEFAEIQDNNAYTNYSAVKTLRLGQEACRLLGQTPPSEWELIAEKMWIPFDEAEQRYVEYEGYNGETIKQADTAILVYPYALPMSDTVKRNTLSYYRSKYPKGNIMMAAAFDGIVDCELGDRDSGWDSFHRLLPHFREPFMLVSESPLNECTSFTTGLGGLLQLLLMGYAGIRIQDDGLQVDPCLPPCLDRMVVKGLHYGCVSFDLEIEKDEVAIRTEGCGLPFPLRRADGTRWN